MPPAAHSFPSCRKRMGRKGALGDAGCILRCDSGRNLIYRYYEHTYSPYGRYGTRRLLRYTEFGSSCDSTSAVKTPCVRNLQSSTNSPRLCRGRCPHRPTGKLRIRRRLLKKQCVLPGRCGHRPLQNSGESVLPCKFRTQGVFTADIKSQLLTNLLYRNRRRAV